MQATGDWSNKSIKKIYIFMEKNYVLLSSDAYD